MEQQVYMLSEGAKIEKGFVGQNKTSVTPVTSGVSNAPLRPSGCATEALFGISSRCS